MIVKFPNISIRFLYCEDFTTENVSIGFAIFTNGTKILSPSEKPHSVLTNASSFASNNICCTLISIGCPLWTLSCSSDTSNNAESPAKKWWEDTNKKVSLQEALLHNKIMPEKGKHWCGEGCNRMLIARFYSPVLGSSNIHPRETL